MHGALPALNTQNRCGERTVHLDGCVEVEAAYYSAPPGWISRRVHVQWDEQRVRLLDPKTGQMLREHLRETAGDIASRMKIARAGQRREHCIC